MRLSSNMEDYLEAIGELCKGTGVARIKDIASRQNVKNPSVVSAIKNLKRRKLVEQERYGYVRLTKEGQQVAQSVMHRHQVLCDFLTDVLGLDSEMASEDACRIEHAVSRETLLRLLATAEFIESQAHQGLNWSQEFRRFYRNFKGGKER